MVKTITEIRSLARSHTRTALNVLVGVMRSKDATAAARVAELLVLAQANHLRCRGPRSAHAPKRLPTLPFRK